MKTTQRQISRLESPGYAGHSLSMLRRVAKVPGARVRVVLETGEPAPAGLQLGESSAAGHVAGGRAEKP